ncbi:MAG: hypothetical protein GXO39_06675 [Thermotogae bacterium]|nr:hypothetical protein [Thermotogota bacterium]
MSKVWSYTVLILKVFLLWLLSGAVLYALLGTFLPTGENTAYGISVLLASVVALLYFIKAKGKVVKDLRKKEVKDRVKRDLSARKPIGEILAVIDSLAVSQNLDPSQLEEIYNMLLQMYVDQSLKDGKITTDEKKTVDRILEIMKSKGIGLSTETLDRINRFNRIYTLMMSPLVEIPCHINLKRGERCHYHVRVKLYKWKKRRATVTSFGWSYRITKNVRIYTHTGDIYQDRDILSLEDTGDLYVTNHRLIFIGMKKTLSLNHSKILDVEIFKDRIVVKRDRGSVLIFVPQKDYDHLEFSVILAKAAES